MGLVPLGPLPKVVNQPENPQEGAVIPLDLLNKNSPGDGMGKRPRPHNPHKKGHTRQEIKEKLSLTKAEKGIGTKLTPPDLSDN